MPNKGFHDVSNAISVISCNEWCCGNSRWRCCKTAVIGCFSGVSHLKWPKTKLDPTLWSIIGLSQRQGSCMHCNYCIRTVGKIQNMLHNLLDSEF